MILRYYKHFKRIRLNSKIIFADDKCCLADIRYQAQCAARQLRRALKKLNALRLRQLKNGIHCLIAGNFLRERTHPRRQFGCERRQILLRVRIQVPFQPRHMLQHLWAAVQIAQRLNY